MEKFLLELTEKQLKTLCEVTDIISRFYFGQYDDLRKIVGNNHTVHTFIQSMNQLRKNGQIVSNDDQH